jgi:hypothetical protein
MVTTGVRGVLTSLTVAGLVACSQVSGPTSSLAGAWRTAPIPSGSGIDLTLTSSGPAVSGTGHQYRLQYLIGAFTVQGRQEIDGTVRLTVTFENGSRASYVGQLVGTNQLVGTWSAAGPDAVATTFYRQ